jgi:hypothetical protein
MRKLIAASTLAASLTLMPAVSDTVHAQDDAVSSDSDDDGDMGLWGLAGLLGLIGLAGLKRRDTNRYDNRRDVPTSTVR